MDGPWEQIVVFRQTKRTVSSGRLQRRMGSYLIVYYMCCIIQFYNVGWSREMNNGFTRVNVLIAVKHGFKDG